MKKSAAFSALSALLLCSVLLAGCMLFVGCNRQTDPFDINLINSYRDIPGITQDEIDAVEAIIKENRTLTYGHYNTTGAFFQPNGIYAGFHINLSRHFSDLLGVTIVTKSFKEYDYLLTAVDDLSVDLLGDLTPTPERMNQYFMTNPIADVPQRVFTQAGQKEILTESDINGKRVGFYTSAANADIIMAKYPHLTFTPVYIDTTTKAAEALQNGEIDAFIADSTTDPFFANYDFIDSHEMFPLAYMPLSVATANPDLQPIISIINKYIDAGGIDQIYTLYHEGELAYAKFKLNSQLTEEEKVYLNRLKLQRTPIHVDMHSHDYPISFYNKQNDAFEGIANDVLVEISVLTGIDFVPGTDPGVPWRDQLQRLSEGQVPMTAFMMLSHSRAGRLHWANEPYTQSFYALISRADTPRISNYQVMRSTVGVVEQSICHDVFLSLFPAHEKIRLYEDSDKALDALEKGEITLLMASEYTLLMQANYREKSGFKINYRFRGIPMDAYFGFSEDQAMLCAIVNKAQRFVDTEDITLKWTSRIYDYSKTITFQRTVILVVSVSVLFLLLCYVFILMMRIKRASKSLAQKAQTDSLTGIYNRRHFMDLATSQMEHTIQTNSNSYVIIFDLDHFKNVNDTHGHLVGDRVLQGVAQRVKETIRPYDLFGRYGGEEFILHIANVNKTAVCNLSERIRSAIGEKPIDCGEVQLPITASFGIACAAPENSLYEATRLADEALYKAKNAGRNRVMFSE